MSFEIGLHYILIIGCEDSQTLKAKLNLIKLTKYRPQSIPKCIYFLCINTLKVSWKQNKFDRKGVHPWRVLLCIWKVEYKGYSSCELFQQMNPALQVGVLADSFSCPGYRDKNTVYARLDSIRKPLAQIIASIPK